MTGDLLPIGAFARLCRLSVKQLRHYADLGLLSPARIDPVTGYRYYGRDQVRDATVVALLRGLDVPLDAIGQVLAGDHDVRTAVLRGQQRRLEERMAAERRTWQLLDRLLTDGLLRLDVALSREPARRLLVYRTVAAPEEIGVAVSAGVGRLMAAVRDVGWTPPVWGIYPADLTDPLRIAVGVQSAEPEAPPGLSVERVPAGPAATAVHVGPYEHVALTYHAVFAWIHERGLRPRGTVREGYLTDPGTTDPAQFVTRIVVPVDEEEDV
ncbi:MerR family transcriptional regulator [Micromonospora zhanjiangensis]|uniref:MerR family transcriptional regulator n=1 Tax=Micromonospora zhanjiangensis TaxID=1522057 RepID=A0ABV8KLZ6_9ACTN